MSNKLDSRRMSDSKLLWHTKQIDDRFERGMRIPPIHIDMGLTKFCNVGCIFCYGKFQQFSKEFIEREPLLRFMKEAPACGLKSVALIGDGEPTCNPAFYEAVQVGADAGLDISTSTNGVLIDTDDKMLTILRNMKWMRFCISAGTREGYKAIHSVDKFDVAVSHIKRMVELKHKHNLKCDIGMQSVFVPTIMVDEMVEESKLAVQLGVDYFLIKQCSIPDVKGDSGMIKFDVNYYDRPEVIEALEKCRDMSTEHTKIVPKFSHMLRKGARPYDKCKSISLINEISGNGDWVPCGYMMGDKPEWKDYIFGNIRKQGFKEILESDRYWSIVKRMEEEFDVHNNCHGACRQDACNIFLYDYLNKPTGINFI